jgi:glycyl-tRNA synthetase
VQALFRPHLNVFNDDSRANGLRYRRQYEPGTPFKITNDIETSGERDPALRDTVTVRDRDSMKQERLAIGDLVARLTNACA